MCDKYAGDVLLKSSIRLLLKSSIRPLVQLATCGFTYFSPRVA